MYQDTMWSNLVIVLQMMLFIVRIQENVVRGALGLFAMIAGIVTLRNYINVGHGMSKLGTGAKVYSGE